jgi:hypothetical protein
MNNLKKKIVHIHIPKCAGNSFFRGLIEAKGSKCNMMQDSVAIYQGTKSIYPYNNADEFENQLLLTKQALLSFHLFQKHEVIGGHFVFSPMIFNQMKDDVSFFTTLREPISRIKSHITYLLLGHPLRTGNRHIVENFLNGKSDIEEAVWNIINGGDMIWLAKSQCLYLGGLNDQGQPDLENSTRNAINHLHLFDLVALTENLDQFALNFEKKYNTSFSVKSFNTIKEASENSPLVKKIHNIIDNDIDARNKLQKLSEQDIVLYEYARTSNLIYQTS